MAGRGDRIRTSMMSRVASGSAWQERARRWIWLLARHVCQECGRCRLPSQRLGQPTRTEQPIEPKHPSFPDQKKRKNYLNMKTKLILAVVTMVGLLISSAPVKAAAILPPQFIKGEKAIPLENGYQIAP